MRNILINVSRSLFYSFLILGIASHTTYANDECVVKIEHSLTGKTLSLVEAVAQAKLAGVHVYIERRDGSSRGESRIHLQGMNFSVQDYFCGICSSTGFSHKILDDGVLLFDPSLEENGAENPLDLILHHVEINNLTVDDAIAKIAKASNIHIYSFSMGGGPKISLSIKDITLREALIAMSKLAKPEGFGYWATVNPTKDSSNVFVSL